MLVAVQRSSLLPGRIRGRLLRAMGLAVSERAFVMHDVTISGSNIILGPHVFVNVGVVIDASAPVVLDAGVYVGPGAMLVTATHAIGVSASRAGTAVSRPIRVGAGSWIGARAIILPGVAVAAGCVIGAGAIVTRDTERDGLYVGSPARRVRTLVSGPAAALAGSAPFA